MAESVALMALETLRDVLIEEARFLSSVGGQVDEVRRQLSTMHSLLKDADKREGTNNTETLRSWVKDLRDLAITAEGVLQRYTLEVSSKRQAKDLKSVLRRFACIMGECASVHATGKEIEVIRSRMTNLTDSLKSLTSESSSGGVGPSNTDVSNTDNWSRKTYGLDEVQEKFVGMKKDMDLLVPLLIRSDGNHEPKKLISICGMGGLGKTTLATKIYNHESVRRHFDARAWVCVTQKFEPKVVFQRLLEQLLGVKEPPEETVMVTMLKEVLEERKCLVVMDDIWEVGHWKTVRSAFVAASKGHSKVLLTSRNDSIVAADDGSYVHELALLSDDEGWELLQKIALPQRCSQGLITSSEYEVLRDHGKDIVTKCGRLPLALSVIGGILRGNRNSREWEKVKHNIESHLKQGKGVDKHGEIEHILDLSYNMLPYNLKPCFLFLGCFPEDTEIDSEKLYLLWMAEGMISLEDKERGETLRDVAERYLCELANRCMVQVEVNEYSAYQRFRSCRLHDLMRDLCVSKGKKEEFLEVVDIQRQTTEMTNIISSTDKAHRLVFHVGEEDVHLQQYLGCERNFTSMRSLLILPRTWIGMVRVDYDGFGRFKFLKSLLLESCDFKDKNLPRGIKTLILIKHLSLESSTLEELPPFVCKLPCLQSLNLDVSSEIRISNVIHKITRLRHLVLPCDVKIKIVGGGKLKLDGLSELETLHNFDSDIADVSHLCKLSNLRFLIRPYVRDEESLSTIVHHISDNQQKFRVIDIEFSLDKSPINSKEVDPTIPGKLLMCQSVTSVSINCLMKRFPPAQFGQNLMRLLLDGCEMEEDPMETLEKLPMLRALGLGRDSFVGTRMVCRAGGFPQLRVFAFGGLRELTEWIIEEKAMPLLSRLCIDFCAKLKMIPEGLRSITTLQEIRIISMPEEFKNRLRVVDGIAGEDYDKINHVPSIDINEY